MVGGAPVTSDSFRQFLGLVRFSTKSHNFRQLPELSHCSALRFLTITIIIFISLAPPSFYRSTI